MTARLVPERVAGRLASAAPAGEAPVRHGAGHPFADYVRAVGRGANLSRPLSENEAAQAMGMILDGAVEPVQLGAFLVVLRYRKEAPEELAGFVRAARARIDPPPHASADLDWPSYADRHRQLPYFVLAALLLAGAGVRVAMHGLSGEGPVTTRACLDALGVEPAGSLADAAGRLDSDRFAYLPLEVFCPAVDRLFALRPLLKLRSAANTFARELNPLGAPAQLQGVFHPTYLPTHRETAHLLGQPRAAVFKGGGGEVQRNPAKPCQVATVIDGAAGEEVWPALVSGAYAWRDEPLDPAGVVALWRGERDAPAPEAAVIGTAAIALKLLGRASDQDTAQDMARDLWDSRPKGKYGR